MKFIIASILGMSSAVRLEDAPDFFNEPTWKETGPSAAGLIQTSSTVSACQQADRHFGIACNVQFATGMNGDEDLGQDIIMKGDKYHYNQNLVQFASGMNGDEDLGQDIIMKGDKYHYHQNDQKLVQFATGMNGDEDLGQDIIMKGDKYHYNQNLVQFATGMNGDEDLGQDIIMKGDKYHYNQALAQIQDDIEAKPECVWASADAEKPTNGPAGTMCRLPKCTFDASKKVTNGPKEERCKLPICNGTNGSVADGTCKSATLAQWVPVVVKTTGPLPECTGSNGPDGVNCARGICSGTNGPKDGPIGTPCTREEPGDIPAYTTDPTAGRPYQTSGDITPTHPADPKPAAKAKSPTDGTLINLRY